MARHGPRFAPLLLTALALLALVPLILVLDGGGEVEPLAALDGARERVLNQELPLLAPGEDEDEREPATRATPAGSESFVPPPPAAPSRRRGRVLHARSHLPLANLYFEVRELVPWEDEARSGTLSTDEEGRFALSPNLLRGSSFTLGTASRSSFDGAQLFELEPSTIDLRGAGELVVYAHPPALVLNLGARSTDGGLVHEPRFWVRTEPLTSGSRGPTEENLAGAYDESGEVLTATFFPSQLSSGYLLVGLRDSTASSRGRLTRWRLQGEWLKDSEQGSAIEAYGRRYWEGFGGERSGELADDEGSGEVEKVLFAKPVQAGDWRGERSHVFLSEPAAGLIVFVQDADGEVADDVQVLLDGEPRARLDRFWEYRNSGGREFRALAPGLHEVSVVDALAPATVLARESVELVAGEQLALVAALGPEQARRLAVGGIVLSEKGRPLSSVELRVGTDLGGWHRAQSDEEGRFELWLRTLPHQLTVRPMAGLWEGRYEPASLECSPGADNLRFTKASSEAARFKLRFEDRRTGQLIKGFRHVTLQVDGAAQGRSGSWFVLPNERLGESFVSAPYTPREDLRWVARVPHYQLARGEIPAPAQRGEIVELTALLVPGYREELRVIAADSGLPIAGATVSDDQGRTFGRTGADGRVSLTADDWPQGLRVDARGYRPIAWSLDRDGLTAHRDGGVRLHPN